MAKQITEQLNLSKKDTVCLIEQIDCMLTMSAKLNILLRRIKTLKTTK